MHRKCTESRKSLSSTGYSLGHGLALVGSGLHSLHHGCPKATALQNVNGFDCSSTCGKNSKSSIYVSRAHMSLNIFLRHFLKEATRSHHSPSGFPGHVCKMPFLVRKFVFIQTCPFYQWHLTATLV